MPSIQSAPTGPRSDMILIHVDTESQSDATLLARELERDIVDKTDNVSIERYRSDPSAQDFGASLAVVLGTPAAIVLAKGIAAGIRQWFARRNSATIEIDICGNKMKVDNISAGDANALAERMADAMTNDCED